MNKRECKRVGVKIDPDFVKEWDTHFWCPHFQQFQVIGSCFRHLLLRKLDRVWEVQFRPCVKCKIRIHSFRKLRRPRLIVRVPNTGRDE